MEEKVKKCQYSNIAQGNRDNHCVIGCPVKLLLFPITITSVKCGALWGNGETLVVVVTALFVCRLLDGRAPVIIKVAF